MKIFSILSCGLFFANLAFAEPVNLLTNDQIAAMTHRLEPKRSQSTDRERVFSFADGVLRISGEGWGYVQTADSFENYHLVLEYKWGEHTWGRRGDKARDAGVFVHCHDKFGDWPKGIEAQLIEGGSGNLNILENGATKILCNYRDNSWTDVKGFRGQNDVEELFGEWNRLEVICENSTLKVFLNGKQVNEASDLPVSDGPIALQSEEAEWFIRRLEIWPLGEFSETWDPENKSTNTGSGADLVAREHAWSPAETEASFELDPDWEIELVAAEPLVCDPVDVVWDKQGRMFVAEMRDYPLPSEHGPLLSRIRMLEDENGDGVYDKATTWADNVDHVQGLLPFADGLLVTSRTELVLLRDTDGDNVADAREVWLRSNDPRHNQLQISSPRLSPDGWIYLNNGLDGKEIYPGEQGGEKLQIARRNLRIHPETREIQAVSGYGQFGQTVDPLGRRFSSSNRSPIMFSVMPLRAVTRNPFAGLTQGHIDIAPAGGASVVYPLNLSHTTAAAHLGTHTAACGLAAYQNDIFVCEPTGQLVTRNQISPDGASLKATHMRYAPQTEFLRSCDTWFRPVNLREGPDGALFVCDMYRRFIDHSRFFPEEFSKTHYMRAGFDHGRIWRVRPKNQATAQKSVGVPEHELENMTVADALNQIGDENARVRFHAAIALGDSDSVEATEALTNAALRDFDDSWMRKAILSGAEIRAGRILQAVIRIEGFTDTASPERLAFVREFSQAIGRRKDADEIAAVQGAIAKTPNWLQLAVYEGLGRSAKLSAADWETKVMLSLAKDAKMADRLAAIRLTQYLPPDRAVYFLRTLISSSQPPEIRAAAFEIAPKTNRTKISELLFSSWSEMKSDSKAKAIAILAKTAQIPLLKKMKAGEINPALLDPMSRWVFLRSKNEELKTLAEELFARPSEDRAAVLTDYLAAEKLTGDAKRGHEVFSTVCATCHKFKGEGNEVGPDITDVRNKPWQGLLSDILDPNRAIEARWTAYAVTLTDGRALLGLVSAETADSVILKGPGFSQTIARSEIASMTELGQSLMPVGIEGSINQQRMADLITFLQGR